MRRPVCHLPALFFFFNDTPTTELYTLSLHDALPIFPASCFISSAAKCWVVPTPGLPKFSLPGRSEEHTSELQSPDHLVCRLLLEKKKKSGRHGQRTRNGRTTSGKRRR